MKLKKAIEVLEQHKSTAEKFKMTVGTDTISEAIDTVVRELEKDRQLKCEICGRVGVSSSTYCPDCSWNYNPIP